MQVVLLVCYRHPQVHLVQRGGDGERLRVDFADEDGLAARLRGISLSARTSGVMVAVKSRVWRCAEGGSTPRHSSTSGSMLPLMPAASRRSASSRTTNPHAPEAADGIFSRSADMVG